MKNINLKKILVITVVLIWFGYSILVNSNNQDDSQPATKEYPKVTFLPTSSPIPTLTPTPNIDKTPPTIYTSQIITSSECFSYENGSLALAINQEVACVRVGDWLGTGEMISIPIVGNVYGNIKKITVDGKDVYWNVSNEIYTRLDLKIQYGLNRFNVEAEDNEGNKSVKYLDVNATKPDDNNVNVNVNQ